MQYCSLQHHTLLPLPITSTIGCCFCFGSVSSFSWSYFSTLFQWHIGHLPTWGDHLSVSYVFAFSYCSWGSQGKKTEVVCRSLLQWTTFCHMAKWLSDEALQIDKKRNIIQLFLLTYFIFTKQKDMTVKYEALRLVGAQNATGDEWRNSSRRNKEAEPKQK